MSVTTDAVALAKAVHEVLLTDPGVQGELGQPPRLYDAAPEDPVFPYLTYGPQRSTDDSADGGAITRHQMTLHVWSRYAGRSEVFGILKQIERALSRSALTATGEAHVTAVTVIYSDVLRAVDGLTLHGLLRVSFTLDTEQ